MTKVTEAIFSGGVLRPVEPLLLREQERVRLTVESIELASNGREAAIHRIVAGFDKLKLRIDGKLPTRDELHERG